MKPNTDWSRFFSITTAFGAVLYLSHVFADEPYGKSNVVRQDIRAQSQAPVQADLQLGTMTESHARSPLYLQLDQQMSK